MTLPDDTRLTILPMKIVVGYRRLGQIRIEQIGNGLHIGAVGAAEKVEENGPFLVDPRHAAVEFHRWQFIGQPLYYTLRRYLRIK